jgi:hypothetical protein
MKAKQLSAIALATAAGVVLPGVAAAEPPVRVPIPAEPITFEAGEVCDFPISFEVTQQNEKITFFSDGRARITGVSKPLVTNLDNGHSLQLNASGPGWIDAGTGQGTNLFVLFPEDVGGPGIFMTHGFVTSTRDENGFFSSIEVKGFRSGNLCDAIA